MKIILMVLALFMAFSFDANAQKSKMERVNKNDNFDLEIYLEPLWTEVKDRDMTFPKTTIITLTLYPVKGAYFKICKKVPYIVDKLIIELHKNPPTQQQLETIARSEYSSHLTKIAKKVLADPRDLFSLEMVFGIKKDISQFQRRESRACASGRINDGS